jgi:hypothetical protein
MKRISNYFLATLATATLLGATAFGQQVSEPGAPKAPSPAGSAGAESTTPGTGATGGVTSGRTRATSRGSDPAPGSINSVGGAPSAVEPARVTGAGDAPAANTGTSRFTPAPPPVKKKAGSGPSAPGTVETTTTTVAPGAGTSVSGTTGTVGTAVAPNPRAATPAPLPATLPGATTTGAGSTK